MSTSECGQGVECYSESDYGIYEGFCGDRCGWGDDCDANYSCIDLGSVNLCLNDCQTNSECRSGYACHPLGDGNGVCWQSCVHGGCDEGEVCNEYGLCGEREPPVVEEPEELQPPSDESSGGEGDSSQDSEDTEDSGSDQADEPAPDGSEPTEPGPETGDEAVDSEQPIAPDVDLRGLEGGCQGVTGSPWALLGLLWLVTNRRRRRLGATFLL